MEAYQPKLRNGVQRAAGAGEGQPVIFFAFRPPFIRLFAFLEEPVIPQEDKN